MRKVFQLAVGTGLALGLGASAALAATPIYATPGVQNTTTYSFTATNTGDIDAYFAGSTARYDETLTMLVNGVATGVTGLDDHTSSLGQMLDLGHVQAGATLTFLINVITSGNTWYSNPALNSDGANHVFSASYAGGDHGIPAGTYVGFEDLPGGHSDWNYHDETFVFTDVSTIATTPSPPGQPAGQGAGPGPGAPASAPQSPPPNLAPTAAVPEPGSWALMLAGFGFAGARLRSARRRASARSFAA